MTLRQGRISVESVLFTAVAAATVALIACTVFLLQVFMCGLPYYGASLIIRSAIGGLAELVGVSC